MTALKKNVQTYTMWRKMRKSLRTKWNTEINRRSIWQRQQQGRVQPKPVSQEQILTNGLMLLHSGVIWDPFYTLLCN